MSSMLAKGAKLDIRGVIIMLAGHGCLWREVCILVTICRPSPGTDRSGQVMGYEVSGLCIDWSLACQASVTAWAVSCIAHSSYRCWCHCSPSGTETDGSDSLQDHTTQWSCKLRFKASTTFFLTILEAYRGHFLWKAVMFVFESCKKNMNLYARNVWLVLTVRDAQDNWAVCRVPTSWATTNSMLYTCTHS